MPLDLFRSRRPTSWHNWRVTGPSTSVTFDDRSATLDRVLRSILRVATVAMGATVPLLSERLDDVSDAVRPVSTVALWATWAVVLFGVLVPSATSLTAVRLVAPIHLLVTAVLVIGHLGDDSTALVVLALVPTLVVNLVSATAEIGIWFVQTSAYGDERRVLLRAPLTFVVVQIVAWAVWVASSLIGVVSLAHEDWIVGAVLVVVGVVLTVILPRRFHRLARRWLVFVPAGVVVHDHVVLAETAMFDRSAVGSLSITERSSDAADLSGRCGGNGVEIELTDFDTVVLAATPRRPGGSALHVKTLWVRPTRPGRAVSAWNSRAARSRSPRR